MKRFLSILLGMAVFLGCSLTAFAGGSITEEERIAEANQAVPAAVTALPSGLYAGTVYNIRSMASTTSKPYMLNVWGGIDSNQTRIDMWEPDGKNEQKFKLFSSGSYYKLMAMCSSTGRVLDAYRPLTSGCSVDIWSNNDDAAQQLVITGSSASGYVISLASNQNLALTAVSLSNDGAVQFKTYTGATNQKWSFTAQSSIPSLPIQPDPNAQNKTNWCWAACVKMVAEHNGGAKSGVSRSPQVLGSGDGVHDGFYGMDSSGHLTVDGVQHAIVEFVKGSDENEFGTNTESVKALQEFSAKSMDVGWYGDHEVELSSEQINKINNDLLNGKYIIGSMENEAGTYAHSVVIKSYSSLSNTYVVFNPWDGSEQTMSEKNLFHSYGYNFAGNLNGRVSWYKYCR